MTSIGRAIVGVARLASGRERGQALALVVGLIAVIGGMTATAVDLGSYAAERRRLQNAADAIALAASQELPNAAAAQNIANSWAEKNGFDSESLTVTIISQNPPSEPNPKVHVKLEAEHSFTFARLIGVESAEVTADAAAIRTAPSGGDGVVPLSVTEDVLATATYGDIVTLKYDAQNIQQGNTSPIRIDGPGSGNCTSSDNYCAGVRYGSESVVCADGVDPESCDGPSQIETETGNKVGGTRTAINSRVDDTDGACDSFGETFEDDPTTSEEGVYRITQECNPFLPGGYQSERILIIPVINELCNGSCTVTIVTFGLFFLEGFQNQQSCTGNDCEIQGRFVRVNQNVGLLAGTFDAEAENLFVRLVE